jgi:exodeoxyribonuclease VII small subunit
MPRRKTNPGEAADAPSFEEALAGLEAIVEAMEHEQLPLEELVAYYEKGSTLLDRCEAVLQAARGRIELITLRNRNEVQGDPEAGDDTEFSNLSGAPDASDDDDNDDDIRLF